MYWLSTTFNRTWAFDVVRRAAIAEINDKASPSIEPTATVKTTGLAK